MEALNIEFGPHELALSDQAYSLMKAWQWVRWDPDGVPGANSIYLNEVLNRLAFEGLADPKTALLVLLQRGKIEAHGNFRWSKFERGDYFQLEGQMSPIGSEKWATLSNLLNEQEQRMADFDASMQNLTLAKLGMEGVDAVHWDPHFSRFGFALCPPETSEYDPGYFEESYTVEDITIFPLALPGPDGEIMGVGDQAAAHEKIERKHPDYNRGRRPKYNWPEACLAVFGQIHRGDLKPQSQAEIERALIAHLGDDDGGPSESTVRPYAKLVWIESQKA